MGDRGLGIRKDPRKNEWEDSDFPIVCTGWLGDNPFIRMTRTTFDRECLICKRPFTVFRWRPSKMRTLKKTQICSVWAQTSHICQSCMQYREGEEAAPSDPKDLVAPKDPVNRDYWANLKAQELHRRAEEEVKKYN